VRTAPRVIHQKKKRRAPVTPVGNRAGTGARFVEGTLQAIPAEAALTDYSSPTLIRGPGASLGPSFLLPMDAPQSDDDLEAGKEG